MQTQLARKIAHHLAACHTVSLGVKRGAIDADARAALRARLTADPNRLLALPYRLGVFLHSAWLLAAYTQLKNRFL